MDSIDQTPTPPPSDAEGEARSTHRESLFLGVEIERPKGKPAQGRIRNISASGALIESDARLAMGEQLVLTFRGVDGVEATVVRKTAKGVGVRFETEIDPAACRVTAAGNAGQIPTWAPPPMTSRFRRPLTPGRR